MKKLLLATTALAMSAGYAAADVALSGDARMGIVYNGSLARELSFTSRARVTFTLSGETDGGLAFGGSFRADNAVGASAGTAGSVFISGTFGRLTMGDTAGAAEFIVGDLAGVGLTGLGDLNNNFYISNNPAIFRPTARYDYTMDGLTVALSVENPATALFAYSIGASYAMNGFSAGIGYEQIDGGDDHVIAFLGAEFEGIEGKVTYGESGGADQFGVSITGSFDATTVTAFGRQDFVGDTHYGLGASYDLGGGASLVGGVVRNGSLGGFTTADFGLSFSF
ncbi:Porin [Roseibaca ekhonensis]|uniref:Porin n=1 Tax=Roseinatronobacter ekhonensis TaxID=254356 RepID=A0A3B0MC80_9RHOB|nr:porin [Roseibaca ekhonensis]SUZ31338.1 Porin [Roseibaca ekhonensis]